METRGGTLSAEDTLDGGLIDPKLAQVRVCFRLRPAAVGLGAALPSGPDHHRNAAAPPPQAARLAVLLDALDGMAISDGKCASLT
jgi:hypothetical protein